MSGCHPSEDSYITCRTYLTLQQELHSKFQTQSEWNNHTKNRIDSIKAGVQMLLNDFKEMHNRLTELEKPKIANFNERVEAEMLTTLQQENTLLKLENKILLDRLAQKKFEIEKLEEEAELLVYRFNEANNKPGSGPTL